MNTTSFHRRNLPHFYRPDSTYSITFRVKNSIPLNSLMRLNFVYEGMRKKFKSDIKNINHNYFIEYDNLLHECNLNKYLINKLLANIVKNEIHKYDGQEYKLICYSVMPNHIHIIFHLLPNSKNIGKIMQNIKRISAFRINKILGKTGNFWQAESYDHIIRDEKELNKLIKYTLMNPVKAGIVENWKEFDHNYFTNNM